MYDVLNAAVTKLLIFPIKIINNDFNYFDFIPKILFCDIIEL